MPVSSPVYQFTQWRSGLCYCYGPEDLEKKIYTAVIKRAYCEISEDIGVRKMKEEGVTINVVLCASSGFHWGDQVSTLSWGGRLISGIPSPITNPLQSWNFQRIT